MDSAVIEKRVKKLQSLLKEKNLDCLIVTAVANVTYLTGFLGDDSWAVVFKRAVYLVTDSRYTEQSQKQCRYCKVIERKKSMPYAIFLLLKKHKSVKTVGLESSTSISDFKALKKEIKPKIKPVDGLVESCRETKDSMELSATRKAITVAKKALAKALKQIKPGITEAQLAAIIDYEIHNCASVNSFDTIVAFGANASQPHHQPTNQKLKKNDTILIDFGAKVQGYCSDLTRCYATGKVSKLYKKAYEVCCYAQEQAIKAVKVGEKIVDVDKVAREIIAKADFPVYGHGTGHGTGLEIHEKPSLSPLNKEVLKVGQIITIEPGIYIPGKLGIRIEDDVLVTETGCEVLSKSCPHGPCLG